MLQLFEEMPGAPGVTAPQVQVPGWNGSLYYCSGGGSGCGVVRVVETVLSVVIELIVVVVEVAVVEVVAAVVAAAVSSGSSSRVAAAGAAQIALRTEGPRFRFQGSRRSKIS